MLTALWAACGKDAPSSPNVPAQILKVSGDSQSVASGAELPVPMVVQVLAQNGSPMLGQTVTWSLATGASGTIPSSTSVTDANGRASLSFTGGDLAGKADITATVGTLVGVVFNQTVTASDPTTLKKFIGDNAAALVNTGVGIGVKVTDVHGNGVSGVTVTWELGSAGGTLSEGTSTSDASGIARVTLTLGATPGTYTVTATSGALPAVTFTINAI